MEDLIERCKDGNSDALDELFRKHIGTARNMAARICGSCQDLEDTVQEALLRAAKSIGQFRCESSFTTWLYKILLNINRDRLRRAAAPVLVSLDELVANGSGLLSRLSEMLSVRPEEEAMEREQLDVMRRAIASLPRLDQAVIWLREVRNLSYKDISVAMGCSIESVRSRLKRARKAIREQVEALS
ncbi:MAG: sigma-70 family RNA polymerase sigma factor [Firmicutes bacterium]|nr:sigma-70 family RNA polymerase sigma factor [Bacillota bacterium]